MAVDVLDTADGISSTVDGTSRPPPVTLRAIMSGHTDAEAVGAFARARSAIGVVNDGFPQTITQLRFARTFVQYISPYHMVLERHGRCVVYTHTLKCAGTTVKDSLRASASRLHEPNATAFDFIGKTALLPKTRHPLKHVGGYPSRGGMTSLASLCPRRL